MDYSLNENVQLQSDSVSDISYLYKSENMNWDNAKEFTKFFCVEVDNEDVFIKISELELEYLDKLSNLYSLVNNMKIGLSDDAIAKYVAIITEMVSELRSVLSLYRYNYNKRTFKTIKNDGNDEIVAGWLIAKLKNSNVETFKFNCSDVINAIMNVFKNDILLNKRFNNMGINTRDQLIDYTVRVVKNGSFEIHKIHR